MLADTLVLTDGTNNHTFSLVSRTGMNSERRESGLTSDLASVATVKNTVDLKTNAKNRHLFQLSRKYKDSEGIYSAGSVHLVISRDKAFPDDVLQDMAQELKAFIMRPNIAELMIGGN